MRRLVLALCLAANTAVLAAQSRDSVEVRFVDAEVRAVFQTLGRYLDRPLLIGALGPGTVTFESPAPVPRHQVRDLIRGLAASQGLEFTIDSAFYRVAPRPQASQRPGAPSGNRVPTELFVLRLRHARAADIASTVGALFGIGTGGGARGLSSGSLSDELRRTQAPATEGTPTDRRPTAVEGEVVLIADELTNALLIRASQADYDVIAAAVAQLDLRPLQVMIQVLIVEARRDRLFSLGVTAATGEISLDNGDGTVSGTLNGGGLGNLALQVMRLGSFDLDAILRAAVSRGDARIVSRPVLLASNNREARILVGSQRPFVQVSRSLPTDAPSRDQVVQYKDVGTKLTVLPSINADGYVSLLIRQEVNSATNETQFDAPIISTREAETEALVRDGQTIVLGGLRERQHEEVRSGIPILSSLPLIGGLFGFQERRTTETELFLFITPMVLRSDEDVTRAADSARVEAIRAVPDAKERL